MVMNDTEGFPNVGACMIEVQYGATIEVQYGAFWLKLFLNDGAPSYIYHWGIIQYIRSIYIYSVL